jgi:hypothetical protein
MEKLILKGRIDEGVTSWTADKGFGEAFKDLVRDGCVTTLFEHQPQPEEVIVDLLALWQDPEFVGVVDAYNRRNGNNAAALLSMGDTQGELILNAPLLRDEVVGFVGFVGEDSEFFEAVGADTEDARDAVWKGRARIDTFPSDARWLGRNGAQRALHSTRVKYAKRYASRLWHLRYREFLLSHSSYYPPALFFFR